MIPSQMLEPALRSLCIQLRLKQTPLIPIDECRRLKWLKSIVGWTCTSDAIRYMFSDDFYMRYSTRSYLLHVGQGPRWPRRLMESLNLFRK